MILSVESLALLNRYYEILDKDYYQLPLRITNTDPGVYQAVLFNRSFTGTAAEVVQIQTQQGISYQSWLNEIANNVFMIDHVKLNTTTQGQLNNIIQYRALDSTGGESISPLSPLSYRAAIDGDPTLVDIIVPGGWIIDTSHNLLFNMAAGEVVDIILYFKIMDKQTMMYNMMRGRTDILFEYHEQLKQLKGI